MSATAFDRIAVRYDELWTETPIGRAQRAQVWRHIDELFQPGDRVLDIGCGTGADAAHLSARGVSVHATDASPAMIQAASARGGFGASVLRAEDILPPETFDGVFSNFGALNCVDDLPALARKLAAIVRPGGSAAICTIGRFCAWETLYYACRLQFDKAFRRFRGSAASSMGVTVHYPTVAQLRADFGPAFELQTWTGIGLLVPPSYVALPSPLVRLSAILDRFLASLPILRAMADHRLLIFTWRGHSCLPRPDSSGRLVCPREPFGN
ncbi:MAG TPA: methyltransferase domain-containing protein [Bryobacteraceae bacterium]|nr:methyltransferase domain-containing protein [Bryobacteraceae bacterium]